MLRTDVLTVYKLLHSLPYSGIAANFEDTNYAPIVQQNARQPRSIVTGKSLFLNTARFKYIKPRVCVPEKLGHKAKRNRKSKNDHPITKRKKDIHMETSQANH